jgi:hypothetical protein
MVGTFGRAVPIAAQRNAGWMLTPSARGIADRDWLGLCVRNAVGLWSAGSSGDAGKRG